MDYSDLVTAVKENKSRQVNKMIGSLRPHLLRFLRVHMNADRDDAEDCVQESIINSLEAINGDRIQNPKYIVSYLYTSCRNNYLKMQKKRRESSMDDVPEPISYYPDQLESIMDNERHELLEWCAEQQKDKYREFILYWMQHPKASAEAIADEFDITVNNAWTRKHRIKKRINECLEEKSNL